ncbi:MAG: flippase-like domain-containing protein [Candidatus Methanoperedens sp.]|nr:flippase-like domain-containing protein [Candidatus Methanoperedens sp.]
MKKQIFPKIIGAILTIALIATLLQQISVTDVYFMLIKINPAYLIMGFILYTISYFLRALRLHILLNREISVKDLFSIVSIHNMALNILPARSGELSYIYLLNKRHYKSIGEGAATLLIVRIFDIISISILFFTSAMLAYDLPDIMINALPIVGFLLFLVILILLMFIHQCNRFIACLRILFTYLKYNKLHFINYILIKLDEMALSFEHIHRNEFILSFLISAMIWITLYSVNYILVIAMGINLPLGAVFLASTFFFMISILPIQGIGGFGTLEGSWAISFIAVGTTKVSAISSGFLAHIIQIFYFIALFLIGFIWLRKKSE